MKAICGRHLRQRQETVLWRDITMFDSGGMKYERHRGRVGHLISDINGEISGPYWRITDINRYRLTRVYR